LKLLKATSYQILEEDILMRSAILRVVAAFAVNIKPSHLLPGIAILFSTAIPLHAQDPFPTTVTDQNQAVNLPFPQSFGGDVDQVGVENGNLTINIPIVSVKGRGMTYNFGLRYGSAFWAVPNPSKPVWTVSAGNYLPGHVVGWETNQPYATWIMQTSGCGTGGSQTSYNSFIFTDSKGGNTFSRCNQQADMTASATTRAIIATRTSAPRIASQTV
jgi:hypothetical protein